MIIQILADIREEGYLEKGRHPTIAPFFAGANVAFRREAIHQIGGYDPQCVTGEDCDVCARLSTANWELYLNRDAVVFHKNPSTIRELMRQWYGYGRYHPYVFRKHNEGAVEIFVRSRPIQGERYRCLFWRKSRWPAAIFVTNFLLLHLTLFGTLAAACLGTDTRPGLALAALLLIHYAWPDLKRAGFVCGWAHAAVRYCADLALFAGAFVGGWKQKILYLSATVD